LQKYGKNGKHGNITPAFSIIFLVDNRPSTHVTRLLHLNYLTSSHAGFALFIHLTNEITIETNLYE